MQAEAPVSGDEGAEELQQAPALSINILQVIRTAQAQNGLKHGDYGRYRQYCARRLRSLYKTLKFLHGKGRYQKKKLDTSMMTDSRWLLIPLVSAERAWAAAMELKHEAEQGRADAGVHAGRKRRHGVARLSKAAAWAAQLARSCGAVGDTRSALEAEAYASWMAGNLLLEREVDWERALAHYARAQQLWGELAKVSDLENQSLCSAMLEEVEPSIRFCTYQISKAGGQAPDLAGLLALGSTGDPGGAAGRGLEQLSSKLAGLAAEAASSQAAGSSASFEWRGARHAVRHERVRLALHSAKELGEQLDSSMEVEGGALEAVLALHDRLINALGEARAAVRAQARAAAAEAGGGEAAAAELAGLEACLGGVLLERTLARGEVQVADAEARFEAAQARGAAGKKAGKGERPAKPEDLVRLHEALMVHAQELGELGGGLGGRAGEALMDVAAARAAAYTAGRAFYVAATYLAAGKQAEAVALFGRTQARVDEAVEKIQELPKGEAVPRALLPRLAVLRAKAGTYRVAAAAEAAAEGVAAREAATRGVGGLALDAGAADRGAATTLLDGMSRWESFAGAAGRGGSGAAAGGPCLCPVPYPPLSVPGRPIMLDTASAQLDYPSLEGRFTRRVLAPKSTFARLFGGWGAAS